jgi:hypothetical protein
MKFIRAMIEAVNLSETSASVCQTAWRNIPEEEKIFIFVTVRT